MQLKVDDFLEKERDYFLLNWKPRHPSLDKYLPDCSSTKESMQEYLDKLIEEDAVPCESFYLIAYSSEPVLDRGMSSSFNHVLSRCNMTLHRPVMCGGRYVSYLTATEMNILRLADNWMNDLVLFNEYVTAISVILIDVGKICDAN